MEEGSASIHDLSIWMEASFAEAQERAVADAVDAPATSEAELEQMVGDALRKSRILSNLG